jgi:hypothetical protein
MSDRVTVRVDSDLVDALDRLRVDREPMFRTRQDLLRYIVDDWLSSHGYLPIAQGGSHTLSMDSDPVARIG